MFVLNVEALKYIKQIWIDIRRGSDSNTVIVGDVNSPSTSMDRSFRQKINTETLA